jgi:hypothetical protein
MIKLSNCKYGILLAKKGISLSLGATLEEASVL